MTMTKKIVSWLACMAVFLSFYSCRQESLLQDNDFYNNQSKYRVYTINKQQVKNDFFLYDKVAVIQSMIFGKTGKSFGKYIAKSNQDSLLTGAVIGINKVLVVENNGEKTYTFVLKRNYPTSKTENLVLKKNPDSTFTGKLIQYDLTLKERELFNAWHSIDLKDRVKVYNVENLNIPSSANRVGSVSFGCFTVLYEDGTCSGEEHHVYGDTDCPLIGTPQQAGAPRILSITEIPSCGGGGNSGSTGGGDPTQPDGGGDNGLTIIFDDIDLNYYSSDNMTDPDFMFWSKVNQFVQAQPQVVKNFNNEYHYVYYYIHTFFKNNGGLTQANKDFVGQRLLAISTWYFDFTKAPYLNTDQRLSLAIWSEKYLLEHPDMTWDEFENQYLTNPCEKTKNMLQKPKMQQAIGAVTDQAKKAVLDANEGEIGRIEKNGDFYPADVSEDHHVTFNNINGAKGIYHNHTYNGAKMLSPPDIYSILSFAQEQPSSNYGDAYVGMIGAEKCYPVAANCYRMFHYLIRFSGTTADLSKSFTEDEMLKLEKDYKDLESELREKPLFVDFLGDVTLNKKGYEKLFFETLAKMGLSGKVILQRVDDDGKIYNINLDANGISEGVLCP